MRRFVLGWKMLGLEQSLGSRIVTYADDLVILCRTALFAVLLEGATGLRRSVDFAPSHVGRQRMDRAALELVLAPEPAFRRILEDIRDLRAAA
jgi:hypothetical protein